MVVWYEDLRDVCTWGMV